MRDFHTVAKVVLRKRKYFHLAILLISLLMVPGLIKSLTPIDIESYDLESPELTAEGVIDEGFTSTEHTVGFMVTIRDPKYIDSGSQAPHVDSDNEPLFLDLPKATEFVPFQGEGAGLSGEGIPLGGVMNLTFLRELQQKVTIARDDPLAEFYRPLVSELTGEGSDGVLSLVEQFDSFMSNRSMLTRPSIDALGNVIPPRTNWYDCGILECLTFQDENLTQAHIDLAAHRMINSSASIFMRWTSNDRAFLPDENSPVIGPYGGDIGENGKFKNAAWVPGRWSASSTWILIQLDREAMEESGYTFSWADARDEDGGWTYSGLDLYTTPPNLTPEGCLLSVEEGDGPCSKEWALLALERSMRVTDQYSVTLVVNEGVNVEVNRELQESLFLLASMFLAVLVLLWLSLRRVSDVAIVGTTLGFSLLWMQGLIGWCIIFGNATDIKIISRSQFSNLLPILILALGIDDSLHALHRYKEERRNGCDIEKSAEICLSRVGRAIMLTSMTTMAAFAANLTSSIPALRSFGIEAALGVGSAFILTGIWAPLLRLDLDNFLENRNRLKDEDSGKIHMVPEHWLARISGGAAWGAPFVLILALILTVIATPVMLSLEGDFKVEDFLDEESDFAQGVFAINSRFTSEGEPAMILIEGDVLDPRVYDSIDELRQNMNDISSEDPDKYTRLPTGQAELHGIDELVEFAIASWAVDKTPFIAGGWNETAPGNGVNCSLTAIVPLPDTSTRGCLQFFYGFLLVYGVPAGGIIPSIPSSIPALYILPDCTLNINQTHLCEGGEVPRYERMVMRWGLVQPEQFTSVELALAELHRDMSPFANLSSSNLRNRGDIDSAFNEDAEYPVTWGIETGSPVIRYVAASSMQNELQGTLILGVFFCVITLWWGFRPSVNQAFAAYRRGMEEFALLTIWGVLAGFGLGAVMATIYGGTIGGLCGIAVFFLNFLWGERSLGLALITTFPILVVVIWLYGLIAAAGYGLNMVTVAIAAMSLGVGIDYVIHVVERYREERDKGRSVHSSLVAMGGASGLALVGSAISDVTGFALISLSPMGFFSAFGLFCALMIALSFVASMVITSSVLGAFSWRELRAENKQAGGFRSLQIGAEKRLGIGPKKVISNE